MENQAFTQQLRELVGSENLLAGDERVARALVPGDWGQWPICVVQPLNTTQIEQVVLAAEAAGVAIVPCGSGSRLVSGYGPTQNRLYIVLHTARLNRVIDHQPDDLTVTCEPGITLAELQKKLASNRQFLALDNPLPERTTIGGLVSTNSSGFSRPAYGTPRDLMIGMRAVMTGGISVRGGGKVVKNVAGYDVCKLFSGAWGTVGILTELTFKIRPINEGALVMSWDVPKISTAAEIGIKLHRSRIGPTFVLATNEPEGRPSMIAGLQGSAARVLWQQQRLTEFAEELGVESKPVLLGEMESQYLADVQARLHREVRLAVRFSCLPTDLPGVIRNLELLPSLRMTAQCAVGTLNVASPSPDPALTLSLRSAAPRDANLQWTRIAPDLARPQKIALWGETRQDFVLHKALKSALDPLSTFSPGRFLGGI